MPSSRGQKGGRSHWSNALRQREQDRGNRGQPRSFYAAVPQRLIGAKAFDSDPLDKRLRDQHGIEMISPNRRKRKRTQDGRPLRRYLRRWKIERLFVWLKNFRRLASRWERYATNFLGMVQLGCVLILLRQSMRLLLTEKHQKNG